ncbi:hypothetical protein M8J75_010831 [Diaphorina citri]|nr:hypothetical protein M8J75_010831 [Diaphorina citri]
MFRLLIKRCFKTSARLLDEGLPPPLAHATGLEKREMLAMLAGNDDPYYNGPFKRTSGTRDDPNLVRSAFKSRLVGCVCEEDQYHIVWMWVEADMPRRCACGHWFKLVKVDPV